MPAPVEGSGERVIASANLAALVELREDVATFLRYMGSVDDAFERGDVEVARNVLGHQRRNLLWAVEKTGSLTPDGYASKVVTFDARVFAGGPPRGEEGGSKVTAEKLARLLAPHLWDGPPDERGPGVDAARSATLKRAEEILAVCLEGQLTRDEAAELVAFLGVAESGEGRLDAVLGIVPAQNIMAKLSSLARVGGAR